MADETLGVPQDDIAPEPSEPKPHRSLWGLIGVAAVAIIVILILLLIPRCGSNAQESTGRKGKTIADVPRYEPLSGTVSVWISSSTELGAVLAEAGIRSVGRIDMGDGRWVVTVRAGSEDQAVAALKKQSGVFDAGRVYEGTR